jgi:16S rRNA (uracil1498-N3)-methyltransferase
MSPEESQERDACDIGAGGKLRLFMPAPLGQGAEVTPTEEQAHYLLRVMRAAEGDNVLLFNGKDGEWQARLSRISRRSCTLICTARTQEQREVPDVWLVFAPIKKIPADYVTQKATELGVRALQPVITHRTVARRVNSARMTANAVEAAEQSGRLSVPEVRAPADLRDLLRTWPSDRTLVFCDEGGDAQSIATALRGMARQACWAVLTGPEGGFDETERKAIRNEPFVLPVTLGPRIMRADTAALAALAIWQAVRGDWH